MSWAGVLFATVLAGAAALWLRTRRYRDEDDEVRRTLSPWWLPVTAAVGALAATPLYAGVPVSVGLTYAVALVWGLTLAFIDLEVHRLPDILTLPAYPVAGVLLAVCSAQTGAWAPLARAAACAGLGVAAFFLLALMSLWFSPDGTGFGLGDVKLSGGLTGLLGWFSAFHAVYGVLVGCIIGGVAAAVLLIARRGRKAHLSYGPSLIAGAYLVGLLGPL
jgi:leader peptidase (prepilin peptidase)/N-methyltransferase